MNNVVIKVNDKTKTLRFGETLTTGSHYSVQVEGGASVCGASAALLIVAPDETQLAAAELTSGAGTLNLDTTAFAAATEHAPLGATLTFSAVLRNNSDEENVAVGQALVTVARPGDPGENAAISYKGPKGDKGDTGPQGPQGVQGPAGPFRNITVGYTVTLDPGMDAEVLLDSSMTTDSTAVFDFYIPRGAQGEAGVVDYSAIADMVNDAASEMLPGLAEAAIESAIGGDGGIDSRLTNIESALGDMADEIEALAAALDDRLPWRCVTPFDIHDPNNEGTVAYARQEGWLYPLGYDTETSHLVAPNAADSDWDSAPVYLGRVLGDVRNEQRLARLRAYACRDESGSHIYRRITWEENDLGEAVIGLAESTLTESALLALEYGEESSSTPL